MARSGVDWVVVDCEHGNIDGEGNTDQDEHQSNTLKDGQMHEAVAALAACGVSPVVRIPANEAWMVKSMCTILLLSFSSLT